MNIPVLLKSSSGIQTLSVESKLMSDHCRLFITGENNVESAMDFFMMKVILNTKDDSAPKGMMEGCV